MVSFEISFIFHFCEGCDKWQRVPLVAELLSEISHHQEDVKITWWFEQQKFPGSQAESRSHPSTEPNWPFGREDDQPRNQEGEVMEMDPATLLSGY